VVVFHLLTGTGERDDLEDVETSCRAFVCCKRRLSGFKIEEEGFDSKLDEDDLVCRFEDEGFEDKLEGRAGPGEDEHLSDDVGTER